MVEIVSHPAVATAVVGGAAFGAGSVLDLFLRLVPSKNRRTVLGYIVKVIDVAEVLYEFLGRIIPWMRELAKTADEKLDKLVPDRKK